MREAKLRAWLGQCFARFNFGEQIDLARAAPVAITKYDRPVVVVMAFEVYERVMAFAVQS
jgi:hypothetical protein